MTGSGRRVAIVLTLVAVAHGHRAEGAKAFVQEVAVEETLSAARAADARVRETIRQAGRECDAGPESWQHEVMAGLVGSPIDSFTGLALMYIVPAMASGIRRCEDLDVGGWIRSALSSEISPYFYVPILSGLANGAGLGGLDLVRDLASDPEADSTHRLWAAEALVAGRRPPRGSGIASLPPRVADQYRFDGLPTVYVETWVPMLLAAVESREAAAQELVGAVGRDPSMGGAADIVRIVGSDVEAYDYRFSPETRAMVAEVLDALTDRVDLPPDVSAALGDALEARVEGRNHAGVTIERRPFALGLERSGETCTPVWPPSIGPVVESVAPGFRAAPRRGDCDEAVQRADFNGDGAEDVLVRGTLGPEAGLVAVIAGDRPSAHVIDRVRANDYGSVAPPGTFRPACDGIVQQIYPHDWIVISYDAKYSANFRFDGAEFERLLGDEC